MEFRPVHPMMDHQEREFLKTRDLPYWAHLWEMGTGKTKVVVDVLAYNFCQGKVDRAVVFAKKGEYANWHYDQVPEHWPRDLPMQSFLYDSWGVYRKSFASEFRKFLALPKTTFKFFIVNVESVSGSKLEDYLDDFFYRSDVALVVDESTCVKNHKAARTKKILSYAPRAKIRRIMTGTAVTESPLDLWGQCLVLKRGILGHSSFSSFRDAYCVREEGMSATSTFKVTTGYRNLEKLPAVLAQFSTQVSKEECLDLPEKVYVKKVIDLSPEHRARYEKLRDEAVLDLGDAEVDVVNALSIAIKLHQVTAGQARDEEGNYRWLGSPKLDATLELLSDHRGKAIVWCPFRMSLTKLVEAIGREFGPRWVRGYFGGVSTQDRQEAVRSFQGSDDGVRFLVGNQQSMGFGTTLTRGNLEIFYANSYRLELRLQSEDRLHRIGQKSDVTVVDLVTRGTVDERLYSSLRSKRRLSDEIMGRPLSDWI